MSVPWTQWGDDGLSRRPASDLPLARLRARRPPGHGDPRLHGLDRHPGGRRRAAQPRPVPGDGACPPPAAGWSCWPSRRTGCGCGTVAVAREDAVADLRQALAAPSTGRAPRARDPGRPRRGHRAGRLRVPHRAQRHHRLHRPRPHAGRAARPAGCWPGQQGVADRRRPAGARPLAKPGPDRPRRLRALRALPGAAGGTRAEVRKLVVTASGGPFRGRTQGRAGRRHPRARRWPTPPGPWARSSPSTPRPWSTRDWRSSRRTCSSTSPSTASRSSSTRSPTSTRWWSSPTAPRSRRPPARHADAHRAGPRLARAGAGRGTGLRLDEGHRPGSSSRSTRRPSRRSPLACHVGGLGGTAPAVFNAANEECVEAFLAGGLPFTGIVDTVAAGRRGTRHARTGNFPDRRPTSWRRRPGRAPAPANWPPTAAAEARA